MYRLISLFDYSGAWGRPFAENGWDVIPWDIKRADFMDINLLQSAGQVLEMFEDVNGILAAPPCTDFAVSGAQYWPTKDADGRTAASLEMVRQVQRLANLFRPTDPDYDEPFFWVAENPVGRFEKLTGLENPLYFHPYEFAGYVTPARHADKLDKIRKKDGQGVTAAENEFVIRCNAYTKKTGIWGEFNRNLIRKPIEPVKTAPQGSFTQRLGGKSDKTKELRNITPMGFAWAFYEANKDHTLTPEQILNHD